jgi:hypothetical protein
MVFVVQGHYRDGYWVRSYYRRSPGETQSLEICRKKHVQETAEFCGALIIDGWPDAVANRAVDYVAQRIWQGGPPNRELQEVSRARERNPCLTRCQCFIDLSSTTNALAS